MNATSVALLLSVLLLSLSHLHPNLNGMVFFPKFLATCFLGLFLFVSLIPWRWTRRLSGHGGGGGISQTAAHSQVEDRKVRIYLLGIYCIIFVALFVVNFSAISTLFRFCYFIVSTGLLIDLSRKIYCRLHFRGTASGIAEFLVESMGKAEKRGDHDRLVEGFESTFSMVSGYLKMNDVASLRVFCSKIIERADSWIRASVQMPGKLDGSDQESSLLDSYTVVEAMVAKRLSSICREALQSESLIGFETLIWLDGKLALAFHRRYPSLGHLILLSISLTLQQAEGAIDCTSREIEYIAMLSELIKSYIDQTLATKRSDRAAIFRTLSLLESHLKESFRLDRKINPAFLMQPFAEVGELLAEDKYTTMPDRDEVLAELRRLLSQFAVLESVRAQMDVGVDGTDTKASYHEDKPFLPK